MRTLARYLNREIGTSIGFVLAALVALFAFFELVNQLEEVGAAGYSMQRAFLFVALSMPSRAYELAPIAALIGTTYALAQLAARSEITIMRVSGLSTLRLALMVMRTGLVLLLATYLFGEVVAPPAERLAQRMRSQTSAVHRAGQLMASGVWVRDVVREPDGTITRLRFVNVGLVTPDSNLSSWRIYEFDRQFHLLAIATAASGHFVSPGRWILDDVIETQLPTLGPDYHGPTAQHSTVVHEAHRTWSSELTPDIFGVVLVQPERMGIDSLVKYIRHLADNRERTDRYEIAFWNKVFYPVAVLVMMLLALPFAYLHTRAGSVSLKIFSGVMIGVAFYMLNKLFSNLGLLNTWPPFLVAALPSLVMLSGAIAVLYWIEHR